MQEFWVFVNGENKPTALEITKTSIKHKTIAWCLGIIWRWKSYSLDNLLIEWSFYSDG